MAIAAALWRANRDLARACRRHPFVEGLADGSLPRARFAGYIGQDAFFLEGFARAYCIAAARVADAEGVRAFHALAGGALEELRLHGGYAAAWGIDLAAVAPRPATRRYVDFLLATAWGADAGLTAAALAPCMRLYAFLGQALARGGVPEHAYGAWIRTYGSPAFEDLACRLEGLLDRYARDTPPVRAAYRYAMECERDFFDSAARGDAR